jgi:dTDP-4-dehydrorhamnose 3,5-epimerase-like enzyme
MRLRHMYESSLVTYMAVAQRNIAANKKRGTIRGLGNQVVPHKERKLISSLRGLIYDVDPYAPALNNRYEVVYSNAS